MFEFIDARRFLKLGFMFLLFLPQFLAGAEKGVNWWTIDPFCGQITSAESEAFPIKAATIKLYRARAKHLPCCDSADALGDVKIDKRGHFDSRKIAPGQYWLVVSWGKTEVPVALWFDGKEHFACDEHYMNIIEVRPSTETATRTITISTESPAHAQTH